MASSRLCGHGGKLYADDVLYYSGRMDAVLFLQLFLWGNLQGFLPEKWRRLLEIP